MHENAKAAVGIAEIKNSFRLPMALRNLSIRSLAASSPKILLKYFSISVVE